MTIFPLNIFPYALSSSVITTVWVGVFVVTFFNLRLGWVLSGLVVPGYLVPLLIIRPVSVAVILLEAVITYCLVWGYSTYVALWLKGSELFGRDRFFILLLVSVLVRIVMDSWFLPQFGMYLNQNFNIHLDYHSALHSFGLIVVALAANQLWKAGLYRGLMQNLLILGMTYLLVRLLIEYTNFNVSNLQYMYEDIAISMLASPKSYIILILTAFIASKLNLHYGWEYNGILIPALLALQWYEPIKIVSSFVEAFVILGAGILVLNLPPFRHKSIEGAYKILLFFNIGFIYKLILGYFFYYFFSFVDVTDLYGFGYLLSTLIAIKMHDKKVFIHLPVSTLQTTIISIVCACIAGYLLTLLPQYSLRQGWMPYAPIKRHVLPENITLEEALQHEKISLYKSKIDDFFQQPTPHELNQFATAVRQLLTINQESLKRDDPVIRGARKLLKETNYQVEMIENRYFLLHEKYPQRGTGIYVIDTLASSHLLIEVPNPIREHYSLEIAAFFFRELNARGLAIAGVSRDTGESPLSNVLRNPNTFYQVFHHVLQKNNVLQIRVYPAGKDLPNLIRIKNTLPEGLNLKRLKQLLENFEVSWQKPDEMNLQWHTTKSGFVELIFTHSATYEFLSKIFKPHAKASGKPILEEKGYLSSWIFAKKKQMADKGSNLYQPSEMEELLYFDNEVLTPLISAIKTYDKKGKWSDASLKILSLINAQANFMGYEIILFEELHTKKNYVILSEIPDSPKRGYRGSFIFRLGQSSPYVIQIPRPIFEINSFEYGVSLFEILNARALIIAGAHPYANQDKTSDLLSQANSKNLVNLVSQVILREYEGKPLMLVQCRTFGVQEDAPTAQAEILLSFADGSINPEQFTLLAQELVKALRTMGLEIKLVQGSPATIGYEASGAYLSQYLAQSKNKEMATVWLSPILRADFRLPEDTPLEEAKFSAAGIDTVEKDLYTYLHKLKRGSNKRIPEKLKRKLMEFLKIQDMLLLQQLQHHWPDYQFQRVIDLSTQQSFLLIFDKGYHLLAVMNLAATNKERTIFINTEQLPQNKIKEFIESRAAWLEIIK
ncbi:poly-gamma-glutamate biosynthesis protein PgsC/CapC [Legionella londiniensis]|uniref:Uncharacterized protein n=1 Tax=Legionella londiniensis TaxID=45068 RepID=A0A0W0VNI4_9GAMM|nr:poly-gamma-glutamate biosynthesis protein PgsC/CapC [Legionella londiniensis]KTD21684.1 hypothetical protein Llon_0849 [Legionella londiniensis]STX93481.1 poly-gamma-glutamate biosynthesis protein PgsC [Legionella londiniensis]